MIVVALALLVVGSGLGFIIDRRLAETNDLLRMIAQAASDIEYAARRR